MMLLLRLVPIVAIIALGVFFAERPGTVTLVWQDWRVDTSVGLLLVGVLILMAVLGVVWRLLSLLFGLPSGMRKRRRAKQRQAAFGALTRSLVSLAAGDAIRAHREAEAARPILDVTPLPLLLAAESAARSGNQAVAESLFGELRARPDSAFLGQRGLALQAMAAGETERALQFLTEAQMTEPRVSWIPTLLPGLEARRGQWRLAREAVADAVRKGALDAREGRRQRLALLTGGALDAAADGEYSRALDLTREALKLDPGFAPAAVLRARLLREESNPDKARRVLEKAWAIDPHPDLARAYGGIEAETPLAHADALDRLARMKPNAQAAQLMAAEADIEAGLWGPARKWLDAAEAAGPVTRALCRLRAILAERSDHDAAAAQAWSVRAATAAADPAHVCDNCGAQPAAWSPLCPTCHQVATLRWRQPDAEAVPLSSSVPAPTGPSLHPSGDASAIAPLLTPLPRPEYGPAHVPPRSQPT